MTGRLHRKGHDRGEGEYGHCAACGRETPLQGGPDPCLGMIPGVVAACCGHGGAQQPYAILANRSPEQPRSGESWHEHEHLALRGGLASAFFAVVREARDEPGTLLVAAGESAGAADQPG